MARLRDYTYRVACQDVYRVRFLNVGVGRDDFGSLPSLFTIWVGEDGLELANDKLGLLVGETIVWAPWVARNL
jgi:hypothetical protein